MRGQISLEYLIIAIIALALVTLSLSSLNKIKSNADQSYATLKFKSLAQDIFNAFDELCALGNGNSRPLQISMPASVESDTKNDVSFVTVYGSNISLSHETKCESSLSGTFENEIVLANDNGKIIQKP